MFEYLFTFRSITGAQRGQQALNKERISCVMMRTPKCLSSKGCGYALKVRARDSLQAVKALQLWQVEFGKLYRVNSSGVPEEVLL